MLTYERSTVARMALWSLTPVENPDILKPDTRGWKTPYPPRVPVLRRGEDERRWSMWTLGGK